MITYKSVFLNVTNDPIFVHSCIDGRLTSSWNWTSLIAKKNYYHAFMMSGFQGFDGDFK